MKRIRALPKITVNDWENAMEESVRTLEDEIPSGWKSVPEIAASVPRLNGLCIGATHYHLRRLVRNDFAECRGFRRMLADGKIHRVLYYRLLKKKKK